MCIYRSSTLPGGIHAARRRRSIARIFKRVRADAFKSIRGEPEEFVEWQSSVGALLL